ncbi:MAG TPA: M48 family metalloprotease [Candidatus Sulfotelmatobacter sp.]|nr:M48 family metalloprotease [Candidatus Sulfotelmatobacter sp.]
MIFKRISFLAVLCLISLGLISAASTRADAQELSLIRDAEIENTIRLYATPLFEQAGVEPDAVQIHLVKDNTLNAFVAEGLNLFINTGLIIKTDHAGQLIGVIAHESGHIAGGHLVKGRTAMENAQNASLAATILGMAAAVAAGRGDVGIAMVGGGNEAALRSYLAFSRGIEASADTAALTFLDNLHLSARGFLEFMEKLGGQELLTSSRQDPYMRTHPVTSERIDEIRNHVEHSPYSDNPVPPQYVELHRRMVAKLVAFMQPPVSTLMHYREDDKSIEARYARAIAYYRKPDLGNAVPLIDGLIAERPKDPYFHELKGQMLFENGRGPEAIPEYRLAIQYLPDNALLLEELGQAEVESEDPAMAAEATKHLKTATQRDPGSAGAWRMLSIAYGRSGNEPMAEAALAEYCLLAGQYSEALYHVEKARKGVKPGSPTALRLEDVRAQAEQGQTARKAQ